uniref:T-box domain-containing protein n=1 Tax=Glossina brevipalpis TaxID=37001 RepID=A0A1A9WT91_9MUSC
MLNVHELMEYRMQQQLAHEIYRQQIIQRIPDPFPQLIPLTVPFRHMIMPARPTLSDTVEVSLENNDLWQQFHKIGTEMIITKSGRRMFPSMRAMVTGLEEDSQYCVLLEMLPIGDCRYKFSGSQWVAAGGAEPQSPQRMFLHPDSPASGSHWQTQAILFNKVKLTNNTLDNNGHMVLASMHKYQPRLHIIKTADLTQLPWSPQQSFIFPETEFIAVTAYQNDRITKLKIDNNPFAKGFRETGQSKCKRKLMAGTSSFTSMQSQEENLDDDHLSSTSVESSQKRNRSSDSADMDEENIYNRFGSTYFMTHLSSFYHDPYHATHHAYYNGQSPNLIRTHHHSSQISEPKSVVNHVMPKPTSDVNGESTSNSSSPSQKKSNFSISAILAY